MREIVAVIFFFLLKTLINISWVTYINPFIPLLAVFFAKKKSILQALIIYLAVVLSNAFMVDNYWLLTLNYLIILPFFLLFQDNFFQYTFVKVLLQGTLALLVFYLFRFIFIPVSFENTLLSLLISELFLLFLTPFYRIFK